MISRDSGWVRLDRFDSRVFGSSQSFCGSMIPRMSVVGLMIATVVDSDNEKVYVSCGTCVPHCFIVPDISMNIPKSACSDS